MSASTELPKSFDPHATQSAIDKLWNDNRAFHAEPTDPGEPYCIVIPPPNVTAALHLGHALNNTLQDILIRKARMEGKNAVWIPGTDHAGIATQTVVEKRVLKEEGKKRTEFNREDFVAKIQAWKDEYEATIIAQFKAMGCSCDFERTAFTMDEQRAKAVREAFFQLFKDGLIYRGKRLVNWDPATQTAIADDEVEMEEIDGHFYYLKYPIENDKSEIRNPKSEIEYVTVATTRPETMLGDTAVGVNPRDPRAAALRGKFIRLPIVNRIIPIVEDDYVVMPDPNSDDPKAKFATGFLKVTPAHDQNDWELGIRHKLEVINVLAPDGTISDRHGWSDKGDADFVIGLDRFEARKAIVEWFRKNKLLEDVKPYRHSVGHSYRSHVPIEPYLSDQWYCKVTDDRLRGAALRTLERGMGVSPMHSSASDQAHGRGAHATEQLHFYPERYAKTFQTWHENLRDWCISRQLWWGHRIPVWSRVTGIKVGATSGSLQQSVLGAMIHEESEDSFPFSESSDFLARHTQHVILSDGSDASLTYFCVAPGHPEIEEQLRQEHFIQDPDVLDTWFSSALWPLSTLGWPLAAEAASPGSALDVWNPTAVLSTAREIITLWVSRMVMFNLYFLNRIPFHDVFIHAMVQDGDGRKMSKSLGNGVDPLDIISSHGCDAMRFTLASMATNTQDVRMPVDRDAKTGKNTSQKFDLGRNFCTKLWNAARFVLAQLEQSAIRNPQSAIPVDESKWSMADRWIVSRFLRTLDECNDALANYRFDQYARACYDFFWRDFCDWYVEASKPAMKDPARAVQTAHVLAATLDASLRLLHPLVPFVTEEIWQKLCAIRPERGIPGRIMGCMSPLLIKAAWPVATKNYSDAAEHIWPRLQEIVVAIRNARNDYKVDPKRPITVSIKSAGDAPRQILAHRAEIEILATCKLSIVGADVTAPPDSTTVTAAGCEIYLEGLVDKAAQGARDTKRRDELAKQIVTLEARLANEGYIARAPKKLVDETRQQLAEAKAELEKLQ